MRYTQIKKSMAAQFAAHRGDQVRFLLLGAPGGGKTSCAKEVIKGLLDSKGNAIPKERQLFMHPSHLDTCDFLGLPELSGDSVRWVPPALLYKIRKGTGPATIILDEFTDSTMPVQNVLSGLLLEKRVGDLELTEELYVVCTGNRTEDKSGANRLSTKLGNRVRILTLDTNLDDWIEGFAIPSGIPTDIIQFLRYKPNQLHSFDPNKSSNPTPRSWEKVSMIPDMDSECYFGNVEGEVGSGAAAEYVAFKKIYRGLPDLDEVLKNPDKAPVSSDAAVRYAISGALAEKSTPQNFDRVLIYMKRMPTEFSVLTVKDALIRDKKIRTCKAFTDWATKHADVLM